MVLANKDWYTVANTRERKRYPPNVAGSRYRCVSTSSHCRWVDSRHTCRDVIADSDNQQRHLPAGSRTNGRNGLSITGCHGGLMFPGMLKLLKIPAEISRAKNWPAGRRTGGINR